MSGDDTPEAVADGQGEATAAEAEAGTAAQQQTATAALSENKDYIQRLVAVFAVVGVGIGLSVFLLGEFGSLPFEIEGEADELHTMMIEELSITVLYFLPLIVLALATFVGVRARDQFSDDQTALVASGAGAGVGTIVFVILSGILVSTQFPGEDANLYEVAGLNYSGLIVNGIVLAIAAAIVAAGVAYAVSRFE